MMILEGLVTINGQDIYRKYGVFLTESKPGDTSNYEELLRPALIKPMVAVSYPDAHGEQQPAAPNGLFREPKDMILYFALVAEDKAQYFARQAAFFTLLTQDNQGWVDLQLTEIDRQYRLRYMGVQEMEQLTRLEGGMIGARFKVKFREPNPLY